MTAGPVAVVGGYGAVGSAAVARLHRDGVGPLRVGGRNPDRAAALVRDRLGGAGEAVAVDVYDPDSLARFCAGCRLVVCAGGASHQVLDRVAVAALAAGADYVDAGGDEPLYDRLAGRDLAAQGRIALVTAGMMPGLSGLLPRWLAARGVTRPRRLVAHLGVMDKLTPAGAVDYLLSLHDRERDSRAVWIGGRPVARAAEPQVDALVPFFPNPVGVHPYLGYEARRLGAGLGLDEVRWNSVFDGGAAMMATLGRLQGAMAGQSDLTRAAAELARAADLDMFSRRPYQLMLLELSGADAAGDPVTRTVLARSTDTSALTGTVLALAARQVLDGLVKPGTHFAAEGLHPERLVEALLRTGALTAFETFDVPAAEAATAVEEGAL
ncbi:MULTISPECIES: saccharopine dehydrogenase NADP-binding domain-containing protein [unclassified Micromonospora]|uniref:saccharopine dehydrogenase NADP-binding domain-containing protein n=1 Tax=unclassified Micromonospora TaxID=2617518 RepID=UPI001C22108F|nr:MULTISPECIES: saccharopine dehydrogenase NADP-binding domain-containing protein [unclassified Micromonospora]MBU8860439.1 saccharopine dehydrogenase NADP-binding domain-containing protein [Micromonospora sp. WMMB482]MDM4779976.1 saccharopine dehydrogenase NADP-binding domain-containing protein [Micromonospora sp. b486]